MICRWIFHPRQFKNYQLKIHPFRDSLYRVVFHWRLPHRNRRLTLSPFLLCHQSLLLQVPLLIVSSKSVICLISLRLHFPVHMKRRLIRCLQPFLNLAESYSLFENFSYYLRAPDTGERLANMFASSGGSSALFGGSYNVLSSDSSSQQSDSGSTSEKKADQSNASSKIKGAVPFAPIALPTSSPEAGLILDSSLSPEIESSLNKYLD